MSRLPAFIEPARAEDLPALQQIEAAAARLFPAQDLPPALAGRSLPLSVLDAARAAGLLWVARTAPATTALAAPLGFLMAEPGGEHCLHLAEMDVLPAHGRRGLGSALLARAEAEARARGLGWLTLSTFEHLAWNAPFYARQGFVPLDESGPEAGERFGHLLRHLAEERGQGLRQRLGMVKPLARPTRP